MALPEFHPCFSWVLWRLLPAVVLLSAQSAAAAEYASSRASQWSRVDSVGPGLSLDAALLAARRNDPWLSGNRLSQEAIEASSVAAGALPDPKVNVGLLNLPTDTFDFNQEAMTQFRVGISQQFPRGRSRQLKRQQLATLSEQFPYQRHNRQARVAVTVSELWLELYLVQQSIALIEADRALFDQLADVAVASYTSTARRTRQQDVIRAELELTRLEDRLTALGERQVTLQQELAKWLRGDVSGPSLTGIGGIDPPDAALTLPEQLPATALSRPLSLALAEDLRLLSAMLMRHPALVALDRKIAASATGVEVARQQYTPEWGVNAGYGYRDDDPAGNERADFFSIGVTLDVPLFHANRQDRRVQSAAAQAEAVKTEKILLLRDMVAAFGSAREQLAKLDARQHLYRERLLPQMHDQAQASLAAYTNDDGDFAEVVRARIAELNAKIEALGLDVAREKNIAHLNYFLVEAVAGDSTDTGYEGARP